MQPQAGPAGLQRAPAAEQQLWTYLTQVAMALRAVHTAGLAVGAPGLAATKVLLTSRSTQRIKIGLLVPYSAHLLSAHGSDCAPVLSPHWKGKCARFDTVKMLPTQAALAAKPVLHLGAHPAAFSMVTCVAWAA